MNIYYDIKELLENTPILISKEKFDKLTAMQKEEVLNNEYVKSKLNNAALVSAKKLNNEKKDTR